MSEVAEKKPVLGITLGDFNGIGPEIIIKSLSHSKVTQHCTPVIYGSSKIIAQYRKLLKADHFHYQIVADIHKAIHGKINVINCWKEDHTIEPGNVTKEAGKCAFLSIEKATQDITNGKLSAIITAPINKENIQHEDFKFPGHTEYFHEKFQGKEHLMFMVSDRIKIGVLTSHVPLSKVSSLITKELLTEKIKVMSDSLKNDFGIQKPKIAVLGLNPHAGEGGILGNEEQDVFIPTIKELKHKGNLVFGPYPADGFFASESYVSFDGILAAYHDQGLIPFKQLAFEDGVNYTAGLSHVRTSPDHGTAYGLVGKHKADIGSFISAIFTALQIVKNRKENS